MDNAKTSMENTEQDYDLTCWYLNQRRVMELVGSNYLATAEVRYVIESGDEFYKRLVMNSAAKNALVGWITEYKPPTLGQLLLKKKAIPGTIFTHYTDYYCSGLANTRRKINGNSSPQIYSDVEGLGHDIRLRLRYDSEHLTARSSYETLSGHRPLLVLAAIDYEHDGILEAIPYVIATPLPTSLKTLSSIGSRWCNRLEVHVTGIDSFALAQHEKPPRQKDLLLLRDIPEEEVKGAFAEIIGEPTVPKDWGGERSDLFSTYVMLDNKRISTAFAFKGPAKFVPMTLAQLGKNGDQIERLFSEPAELLILQHCHEIKLPVRNTMRAYANQMSNLRLFCLIDGYDTIRVLRAYSKCGFTPTSDPINNFVTNDIDTELNEDMPF